MYVISTHLFIIGYVCSLTASNLIIYKQPNCEDDVCPTYLDVYTLENPKIVT